MKAPACPPAGGQAAIPPRRVVRAARGLRRELPWLAVLALAILVVHHGALLFGRYFYEDDTILYYWPLSRWLAGELAQGRLPTWLPRIFGGYPLLADGEMGELYPPNVVALLVLSPAAALIASRVLHGLIAAWGGYALGRTYGQSPAAATVVGAVFALGSFNAAQWHHENVIRSAAWLPLILALAELACRARDARRWRYVAATAAVLAISALGLHVQPVLLSLLALGGLVLFHALTAPSTVGVNPPLIPFDARAGPATPLRRVVLVLAAVADRALVALLGMIDAVLATRSYIRSIPRRLLRALVLGLPMTLLGLGLAGIQWVPLFEQSRASFRAGGVDYAFATAFALPPIGLVQALFPYFFRGPDGGWWSLWSWWETELYLGVMPLLLATLGAVLTRRRVAIYFLLLAVAALFVALADRAPLDLHLVLWHVPFYGSLRAPGRYVELTVLGGAVLAGFGLDALAGEAERRLARSLGRACVGLAALLLVLFVALQLTLNIAPNLLHSAGQAYLAQRHQSPDLTAQAVADGLAWAMNPLNPRTLLALALLAASGLLLLLRPRMGAARWTPVVVVLCLVDLVAFASGLHPAATLDSLNAPPAARAALADPSGGRVLTDPVARAVQADRLAPEGIDDASGYAQLESQRHFDYWTQVTTQPDALLDLWGVRTVALAAPAAGRPPSALAASFARAIQADPGHFQPGVTLEGVQLLRNTRALPPAFVVGRSLYRASRDEPTALERMREPWFDPRRNVILEDGPPPSTAQEGSRFTPATLERLGPDRMRVRVTLDTPGYLVVTESYHRGWVATVDGDSAPVYLADFLFLGVPLRAGAHTVELSFAPLSLRLGAAASLLSALALLALLAGHPAPSDLRRLRTRPPQARKR